MKAQCFSTARLHTPANVACHCKSLGAQTFVVSCVGDDDLGQQARNFLDSKGVDTSCLASDPAHETGVVLIELDAAGKPSYTIKEGVAWDNIPFTEAMINLAPQLDAVCFGSLSQRSAVSGNSISQFLEAMPADSLKVFDINIRLDYYTDQVLLSSLEHANALKVNDEELPLLAKLADLRGSDDELLAGLMDAFNLKLVILTYGPKGALMVTRDSRNFAESPDPGEIISTVGAGDSFTATTIIGYLNNWDLDTINRRANEVAAYVCTQVGAVPDLPKSMIPASTKS